MSQPLLYNLMDVPNWDGSPKTEFIQYDRVEFDLPGGATVVGTITVIKPDTVYVADCSDGLQRFVPKTQLRSAHTHKALPHAP